MNSCDILNNIAQYINDYYTLRSFKLLSKTTKKLCGKITASGGYISEPIYYIEYNGI